MYVLFSCHNQTGWERKRLVCCGGVGHISRPSTGALRARFPAEPCSSEFFLVLSIGVWISIPESFVALKSRTSSR